MGLEVTLAWFVAEELDKILIMGLLCHLFIFNIKMH